MKEAEIDWISPDYPGEKPAFIFDHQHKGYARKVYVYAWNVIDEEMEKWKENFIGISIEDEKRNSIGTIDGELLVEDQEVIFYTHTISNNKRFGQEAERVPRVVGATIANFIISGTVNRWISSSKDTLSASAIDMYEKYLAGNLDLQVIFPLTQEESYQIKKCDLFSTNIID